MNEYQILRAVNLGAHHVATGRTIHRRGSIKLPTPSRLLVVRYPDDQGYYLLYLDDRGIELTDTLHESLDEAFAQAEWEFGVTPEEWRVVDS